MKWLIPMLACIPVTISAVNVDAGRLQGRPHIIDGDTVILQGRKVRLAGVDAPELDQSCNGWPAGEVARDYVVQLASSASMNCRPTGKHSYDRIVASCTVAGVDIALGLVSRGLAANASIYPPDYSAAEAGARQRKLGIWKYGCRVPWLHRRRSGKQQ